MKYHRILVVALAATLAISLTGCTGFLRKISSDNKVTWGRNDAGYLIDTRDFTMQLPGEWSALTREQSVQLPGHIEYNTGAADQEGVWVQTRGQVRNAGIAECATEHGDQLPGLGWSVDGRPETDIQINGLDASMVRASRDDRQLRVFCVRSNQSALVTFYISAPHDVDELALPLLESVLTWK